MLTGVTLTGADDTVSPDGLAELQFEFTFAEFGILIGTHSGHPRFPRMPWVDSLRNRNLRLAMHLCGTPLREFLDSGELRWRERRIVDIFQRVQLNFHGRPPANPDADHLAAQLSTWSAEHPDVELIIQLDGVNDSLLDRLVTSGVRASGLYDRSHGSGRKPNHWPPPNPKWDVGYAGGLGPETIFTDLCNIKAVTAGQRFWIDMESRLRTQDGQHEYFDLRKCTSVLRDCAHEFDQ